MLCRVRLYCGQQKQYVILIKYDYTTAHSFYTTNDVVYIALGIKSAGDYLCVKSFVRNAALAAHLN